MCENFGYNGRRTILPDGFEEEPGICLEGLVRDIYIYIVFQAPNKF